MRFLIAILLLLFSKVLNGQTLLERADKLYLQKQFDEAVNLYKQALIEEPDNPRIIYNLGNAKYKTDDTDGAISAFKNSVEQSKDANFKAKANNNLGLAFIKAGKLEEAIRAFKEALTIIPDDKECRENLQMALNEIKKQSGVQSVNKNKDEPQQFKDKNEKKSDQSLSPESREEQLLNIAQEQELNLRSNFKRARTSKVKTEKDW